MMKCRISIAFLLFSLITISLAESKMTIGSIHGFVRDRVTQEGIPGATVRIVGSKIGGKSDLSGKFQIDQIPVGTSTIRISVIGYAEAIRSDIQITAGRSAYLLVELETSSIEAKEIVVKADPFQQAPEISTSTQRMAQEEIRRAPGAREDLSRAVQIMPGVQMNSDDRNDLVVRGGSPTEVLFRIDGIEFPNPNHFGTQGATGGPIGMINNDFVADVNFLSGGFPARFGDKLSAVVDVNYREGNPKFTGNTYFGFAGAGGVIEGPIGNNQSGSYIFSIRKSWLDLISGMMNYGAVPHYQDAQFKLSNALSPVDRISILGIAGSSDIKMEPKLSDSDIPQTEHILDKQNSGVIGVNFTHMFPKVGYTRFIASLDRAQFDVDVDTLESIANPVYHRAFYNSSIETQNDFRNEWTLHTNAKSEWNFGIQYKRVGFDYRVYSHEPLTSFDSSLVPPQLTTRVIEHDADLNQSSWKGAGYLTYSQNLGMNWVFNLGGRFDYFDFTEQSDFSPRIGVTYRIGADTRITGSYGWFTQAPPLLLLNGNDENRHLKNMKAEHIVIGFEHLLDPFTRVSLEVYDKKYSRVPVSRDRNKWVSMMNSGTEYGGLGTWDPLVSDGDGQSYGIEGMIQKKLQQDLYGIATVSWSRTFYTAYDKISRRSSFDTPIIINFVGGWKPNDRNDISFKWSFASGTPYTPVNETVSRLYNYEIRDTLQINSLRRPPYHRLDLRYDYRTFFNGWNLVSWFSIENIYNRQNLLSTVWNRKTAKEEKSYQTGLFPIGGFTVEW